VSRSGGGARVSLGWFLAGGVVVALVLAFGVSRWASSQPDGLERVAGDHSLDTEAADHALADGPLADYGTRGIEDEGLGTGVAGIIGVAVTFAVCLAAAGLAAVVGRHRRPRAPSGA
jgi:hypothetical protein